MNLIDLLKAVDERKARLDTFRPLPAATVDSMRKHISLAWTYHSNAIEGNTLDLYETKAVLEDGITIGGKSLREHLEAVNHRDAIHRLEKILGGGESITAETIKKLHYAVLKGIREDDAGRYRNSGVFVVGANFVPTNPIKIDREMGKLEDWYNTEAASLHPIERAAQLHTRFVTIHPFIDGNGRTARLLMNLELMRCGYPPAIIKQEERRSYFRALDNSREAGDYKDITRLVALRVAENLDQYLHVISGEKQQSLEAAAPSQAQAETLATEQRALLENASLQQTLDNTLKSYVEAKHAQIGRLESKLGEAIERQQARVQQVEASPPKPKWYASGKSKAARHAAWQKQRNQQYARLDSLKSRQYRVGRIKDSTDTRHPNVEELATRKLRLEHPELAASWDSMREAVRRKEQQARLEQEKQEKQKQAQAEKQSQGQALTLGQRMRPD